MGKQQTKMTSAQEEAPAFRVLTVVARPLDQSALPEIGDAWSLADRLAQVQAPVELAFARPPTVDRLRQRLAEDWDVVHFDGHGIWAWRCTKCGAFIGSREGRPDPTTCPRCDEPLNEPAGGYLAFEQEDGLVDLLAAREMAEMLCPKGGGPRARVVILTACQSAKGSPSLAQVLLDAGIPAVLGMKETVSVGAVGTLLPPFYANLGAGRTPREALDAALPALRPLGESPWSGTPWVELPVLAGPGADGALCERGCRAPTRVERERLVGVPAVSPSGAFHGDFVAGDPPGGRKGYLVRLARALVGGQKLVVVTGVGGIGKTALAAATVRRVAWRYPGGVFWVDGRDYLETGIRVEQVLSVFADEFGGDFLKLPVRRQRELALDYLRRIDGRALVVVDNADVADEGVWRFLRAVPKPSAALVTTRTAPEYGAYVVDVAAMTPREGLTFLVGEIGRGKDDPAWATRVRAETRKKLVEVADRLDGHALALLQAAALVGGMGLEYALSQARANPARGETGRRFDFSYNPLPEGRKEVLHRLAAFAAGFDLQGALNVCTNALGEETFEAMSGWDAELPELVRGSFVERQELVAGYHRFRLHPVMREFVRGKAGAEAMAAHDRRMARYFTALAGWGRDQLGDPETALGAIGTAAVERGNLLAAQEACLGLGMWDEAVRLAYDLNWLFERSGHWADRRRVLERGIRAAQEGGDENRAAELSHNLGVAYQDIGKYGEARARYEQALEVKRQLDDRKGVATELHQLGMVTQAQGDYAEARRLYQESLEIQEAVGDRAGVGISLQDLGKLAQDQGDYAEARRLYQESLEIARALGDRAGVASSVHQLGVLAQARGDYAEARRLYEESLEIERALGDRAGVAKTLHQLGVLAQDQGDYSEARRLYEESLEIEQALGARVGVAYSLGQLGTLELVQGNLGRARELYEQVRDISGQMSDRASVARALHQLGRVAQNQGDYTEARRLYEESLETEQALGDRAGVAGSLLALGNVACLQGDYAEARRLYEESLKMARALGSRARVAGSLQALGNVAYVHRDYAEARRLYEESLEIGRAVGDRAGVALSRWGLGSVAKSRGDYDEARKQWKEGLGTFRELGERKNEGGVLHQLGMLAQDEGDYVEARRLYEEALGIERGLGDRAGVATTLHNLGNVAYLQRYYAEARWLYEEALGIERALGNRAGVAISLHQLGMLAEEDGDLGEAERLFSESLGTFEALHSPNADIARRSLERVRERTTR